MKPLSIIIPIYNVEKYLRECLDSIQKQSYSNFQAIMINDGSSDRSRAIASEYAARDKRFLLINQSNKGLGEARNAGLNFIFSAENPQDTQYIGLVDSDDVIASDYYENLIYSLEYHNTQVAKTRNICVFKDNSYDSSILSYTRNKEKGIVRKVRNSNLTSKIDPWRSVFSVSLLKSVRFPPVRFAEDVGFGVCVNILAKRIALTKSARYFYRLREGSLTREMSHRPQEMFNVIKFIYDFLTRENLLYTYSIPTHILRVNENYLHKYPNYFNDLQNFVSSLKLDSKALKKNPSLKAILDSKNMQEYLKKTQSFKEWRHSNFRIHISKKQLIIKLFGKTILQK
ncbi:glycosyltransferase [Helicobacter saguini]|uniref:Glycosyltransferase n=1 Tax=Helicobacter saguini TaxID=1548018 RepID=A0A347VN48_9HELI|nr:glycosyltransferase family 2 protein [Helicobacter saguini]MWV61904.1 glycosyltransferase [Helicobacter saguini]MWV67421.1 glycosyltransferase [Helicobacter saguini]MWV69774.1 glycosyltransferase [Helicobacter saguini]MWV73009.1 glycosyltransferase [Helicobacter saguini]TLD95613.1 glycosyltransferase family 2 protein [Helicobacter saguini]